MIVVERLRASRVAKYGVACLAPALTTALKVHFDWLGRDAPVAVYLGAVMCAAWLGGTGPGLVATALSCVATAYFFVEPHGSLAVSATDDVVRLVVAAVEGSVIAVLVGQLLRARELERQHLLEHVRAERELRERTEQLLHAQRVRALGDLAALVVHDVNNMATVVLASVGIAERQLPDGHRAASTLANVREAVDHTLGLTGKLTGYVRKEPPRIEDVDLHDVLRGLAPVLERLSGDGIEIAVEPAAGAAVVRGDRISVEQVVVNLVSNARDAMPRGGRIVIGTDDAGADRVELTVRDSGRGMDAATVARVFEPFFTTKPAGQGTGLGLALVRSVVDGMGGAIEVDSAPDRGTTFRVRLPVATRPPSGSSLPGTTAPTTTRS